MSVQTVRISLAMLASNSPLRVTPHNSVLLVWLSLTFVLLVTVIMLPVTTRYNKHSSVIGLQNREHVRVVVLSCLVAQTSKQFSLQRAQLLLQ